MLLCALWGTRHVWFQHQGLLEPRLSLNTWDRKLLRVTWPDSSGPVRYLPSTFELWTRQFQVVELFSFLFKSSHVHPINICEVKYFLYNQSVWDVRKLIFYPHFVFETKDFHPLCDSSWRRTCWLFFLKWKRTSVWKAKNLETSSF